MPDKTPPYGDLWEINFHNPRGTGRTTSIIKALKENSVFGVVGYPRDFRDPIATLRGFDFYKTLLVVNFNEPQDFDRLRGLDRPLTIDHAVMESWMDKRPPEKGDKMIALYRRFCSRMNREVDYVK